jgi:hypothetical protein
VHTAADVGVAMGVEHPVVLADRAGRRLHIGERVRIAAPGLRQMSVFDLER